MINIFKSQRNVVRLGEHKIGSTIYGPHKDIAIALILSHDNFDGVLWINDIAMIYLERDVEFTGFQSSKSVNSFLLPKSWIKFKFIAFF